MPRKKEYDRGQVVDKAMKVFWQKGYDGTSIQDLVTATGLNRFGMYQAFGSKEGLFLEAVDTYRNRVSSQILYILNEGPPGMDTVRQFFSMLVEKYSRPGEFKGCLITNTAIESPVRGKDAASRVKKHFRKIETGIQRCLDGARKNGEIQPGSDTKKLSCYLLGITQGLAVLGRTSMDREALENMVDVALEHLPSGKRPEFFS